MAKPKTENVITPPVALAPAAVTPKKRHRIRGFCSIFFIASILGLILIGAFGGEIEEKGQENIQRKQEDEQLANYKPSAIVQEIADATALTDEGKRIFYLSDPRIDGAIAFNDGCRDSKLERLLGCYANGKIHVYEIVNKELYQSMYVTAAHEMLHAAYWRLNEEEQKKIGALITDYYSKNPVKDTDESLKAYKKAGLDISNELHSRLGTEFVVLNPELEQYYARYFTNRKAIAQISAKMNAVFQSRVKKLNSINKQLKALNKKLTASVARLNYYSTRSYTSYYNELDNYNALIKQFNKKVKEYNVIVKQLDLLYKAYGITLDRKSEKDTK